ncbi:MAG: AraC family transcriptional regulator [Prevotella sp.]|nr:AraC family transcriptional regulator [Prevotella sp.]
MSLTYATTMAALAVTLICFGIITDKYRKAGNRSLTIKWRTLLGSYIFLIVYLSSYFFRHVSDETEIFSVPSMLMLYCLWESYLFTCTTFSNGKLYQNRYTWLFYNLLPISLTLPYCFLSTNGQSIHLHSYGQLTAALAQPDTIQVWTKIVIAGGLGIMKLIILTEVIHQQRRYRQQIMDERGELRGSINRTRSYTTWGILLVLMSVGQFIPSQTYHLLLKLGIILSTIYTTHFYTQFHKRLMAIQKKNNNKGESIKEKVNTWLSQTPFPLGEADLTMEKTAESIGITASSLSYYIYEFAGRTFRSWQSECRMDHCRKLLEDKKLNISEIAYECGYSDLAAMSKAFKRRFGLAPTLYRRRLNGNTET